MTTFGSRSGVNRELKIHHIQRSGLAECNTVVIRSRNIELCHAVFKELGSLPAYVLSFFLLQPQLHWRIPEMAFSAVATNSSPFLEKSPSNLPFPSSIPRVSLGREPVSLRYPSSRRPRSFAIRCSSVSGGWFVFSDRMILPILSPRLCACALLVWNYGFFFYYYWGWKSDEVL